MNKSCLSPLFRMIKKLKKKYLEYQIKNMINMTNEISYDIANFQFEKANSNYYELLIKYKKFNPESQLQLSVIRLHLLFCFQKYEEFFERIDNTMEIINADKHYESKYKTYYRGFISNLKMIIYLINDEFDSAEKEKKRTLSNLDIKMSEKEFSVLEYKYPIYDEHKMKSFFESNRLYDNIPYDKKEFVINYLKKMTIEIKEEVI